MSTTTVSTGHSAAGCASTLSGGSGRRGTFAALDDEPPHATSPGPPNIAAPPTSPAARKNSRRLMSIWVRERIPWSAGMIVGQRGEVPDLGVPEPRCELDAFGLHPPG